MVPTTKEMQIPRLKERGKIMQYTKLGVDFEMPTAFSPIYWDFIPCHPFFLHPLKQMK
jgi:hypothetical protein